MISDAGSYAITWVESVGAVPADLWGRCFAPHLEGRWWYAALESCGLEDQFRFFYGVIADGGGPIGVAPAFVMDVPIRLVVPDALLPAANLLGRIFPALLHQRTLFVGSPCSDEGALGLAPGCNRREVYRFVHRAVCELADRLKAPMRVWKDFPEEDRPYFAALIESEGVFPLASFPGTIVSLSQPDKASYLASLTSSRRNKLKKKLRPLDGDPLSVSFVDHPTGAELDEIFALFWKTYEKGKTKFERLNAAFFTRIAEGAESTFIVIRDKGSGAMVAMMLCFVLEQRIINKFIGIDYDRPKEWFLYFRLWEAVVDLAISKRATSIQSGQTAYAPKLEIGHKLQPLTNYVSHRNPLMHWIYRMGAKTVSWETLDKDLAVFLKAHPDQRASP